MGFVINIISIADVRNENAKAGFGWKAWRAVWASGYYTRTPRAFFQGSEFGKVGNFLVDRELG